MTTTTSTAAELRFQLAFATKPCPCAYCVDHRTHCVNKTDCACDEHDRMLILPSSVRESCPLVKKERGYG